MCYEDENIWLTQKMMATLYDVSVPAINQHLKRSFACNELTREATVKQYLIVQTEGSREVRRELEHYNLQAIIAVDFKIENERAVQFRKWANQIVKDYTIHGQTAAEVIVGRADHRKENMRLTHWKGAGCVHTVAHG
ncbi:MAG: virulence RhuM family protein [Porticoccaceae bacterium]|nr:virulence RhuM family protein [Porticoccaceae bacterium]